MTDNIVRVGRFGNKIITDDMFQKLEDDMFVKILTGLFSSEAYSDLSAPLLELLPDDFLQKSSPEQRIEFNQTIREAFRDLRAKTYS